MKRAGYFLVKLWIKAALHVYHVKIEAHGLENVPKNIPVLFLPNHQSALLDVLLIAVDCGRKPYFLTRSDVFKGTFLKRIFDFFQMIPIYRIRDGRDSLKNNQAVFDRCSELLLSNEAILMFPEANHNLKRRVRPLSKGFTRILFNTLDKATEVDIQIVPIGINYRNAVSFPDKVALYFGMPISIIDSYNPKDEKGSVDKIKKSVSDRMKKLTTHISDEDTYDETLAKLDAVGVDYLRPSEVNETLRNIPNSIKDAGKSPNIFLKVLKAPFMILNLPILVVWRVYFKTKVWEPEFMGTLRFAYALLVYPIYYGLLFVLASSLWNSFVALGLIGGVFLFNWIYVKLH